MRDGPTDVVGANAAAELRERDVWPQAAEQTVAAVIDEIRSIVPDLAELDDVERHLIAVIREIAGRRSVQAAESPPAKLHRIVGDDAAALVAARVTKARAVAEADHRDASTRSAQADEDMATLAQIRRRDHDLAQLREVHPDLLASLEDSVRPRFAHWSDATTSTNAGFATAVHRLAESEGHLRTIHDAADTPEVAHG